MMDVASVLLNTKRTVWGLMGHSDKPTDEEVTAIEAAMGELYPPPVSPYFNGWYFSKSRYGWAAKKLTWDSGGLHGDTLDTLLASIKEYELPYRTQQRVKGENGHGNG